MCGIAGIFDPSGRGKVRADTLKGMAAIMRHRGPDGFGFYRDEKIGLAHARLSIIDLEGGWQPIHNEDQSVWIVFNGEIFNYIELRQTLQDRGHRFYTKSDTEVVIHLYEDHEADCLHYLNGQFAFAIWEKNEDKLFIARDRVGIRPLFYTRTGGVFLFASEIKSLFMDSRVKRELDLCALDQIFTFWMSLPPRTAFKDVMELPAGYWMEVSKAGETIHRYWDPDFTHADRTRSEESYAEELLELLIDATRLQLRADVPVGAYLSGGLDSSVIATLIKRFTGTPVRTFSVTFHDEVYDESLYQAEVIKHLETDHNSIHCSYADIGQVFPEVIWHTEKPVLRTAPAPLYILSGLVHDSGYKVVLTGEGSDEIMAGYDIFKEAKIRRFIDRFPESKFRPLILKRLYPYLENSPIRSVPYAEAFFNVDTDSYPSTCYAHVPRWNTTSRAKLFFSDDLREALSSYRCIDELHPLLGEGLADYDGLSQAQYLEIKTLLSGYLLSSQGDRVAMAHSVEGRFPFLDHRVMEFCFKLPPGLRLRTLNEKYLLKKCTRELLPQAITDRSKQPYMAPDAKSFMRVRNLEYVNDLLSENRLKRIGYFNSTAVGKLVDKLRRVTVIGFKDNMALVGILSTMLVHDHFMENFESRAMCALKTDQEEIRYAVEI